MLSLSRCGLVRRGCRPICLEEYKRRGGRTHCTSEAISTCATPFRRCAFRRPCSSRIVRSSTVARAAARKDNPFETIDEFETPEEPEAAVVLVACGIGLFTGSAVVGFNWLIHQIQDVTFALFPLSEDPKSRGLPSIEFWPLFIAAPVLGGLSVGAIRRAMDNLEVAKKSGAGVTGRWPVLRTRLSSVALPLLKASAAAVTLGTGNSLGPEGPSVDLGKSSAKGLGDVLRSKEKHITALLAAGSAAGVAAGFNAPISGVFFAIETVLAKRRGVLDEDGDEDSGLIIAMLLLAAVLAATVSRAGLGSSPAFVVPDYQLVSVYELPLYGGLGAICGTLAATFIYWSKACNRFFDNVRDESNTVETMLLPAVGGLTTGVLGLAYPEIMYQGFENVNKLLKLNGEYGILLLLQIVTVKLFATGISKACGLVGGLYAPSIFLGAAVGSAFADLGHVLVDPIPGIDIAAPQAYALVGVAAMLASVCQVPLTAILLLFELTQDYTIIVPTLGAVGISYWLGLLLRKTVIAKLPLPPVAKPAAKSQTMVNGQPPPLTSGVEGAAGVGAYPPGGGFSMGGEFVTGVSTMGVEWNGLGSTPESSAVESRLRQVYLSWRPSGQLLEFPGEGDAVSQLGDRGEMLGDAVSQGEAASIGDAILGDGAARSGDGFVVLSVGMAVESALGQLKEEGKVGLVCAADGQLVAVVNRQILLDSVAVVGTTALPVES